MSRRARGVEEIEEKKGRRGRHGRAILTVSLWVSLMEEPQVTRVSTEKTKETQKARKRME